MLSHAERGAPRKKRNWVCSRFTIVIVSRLVRLFYFKKWQIMKSAIVLIVLAILSGCAVLTPATPTLHAYLIAHAAGVADVATVGAVAGAGVNVINLAKDLKPASGVK